MLLRERLGINKKKGSSFPQTLFYFMKEFHFNPLGEEYIVHYKGEKIKIIKKGLSIKKFNLLIEEMNKHYQRENIARRKGRKR